MSAKISSNIVTDTPAAKLRISSITVYVASAAGDVWADPKGEFLAAAEASRGYALYGLEGLPGDGMPAVGVPLHGGRVGYHIRDGKHDVTPLDWTHFISFADKQLK